MASKIIVLISLIGCTLAAPTFYSAPQQGDSNIIVGSSVSGPRTFDSPEPIQEDATGLNNAGTTTFNSGSSDEARFQASASGVDQGLQGLSLPQGFQTVDSNERLVSGPLANPSIRSGSISGNFPGFEPFGGFGSITQNSGNQFSGSVGSALGSQALPAYEEHVLPRSGPLPVTQTITNQVTKTHTLRVPVTSDVWVTSVTMVTVPVTQLSTQRRYVPGVAGTVTSVVRITRTPVSVLTRTVEVFPAKTMVSVFTTFATSIRSVEFWQPIVHIATNYEVMTVPVLQTQTLLQRVFTTVTVTRSIDVTSTRQLFAPRSGPLAVRASHTYY